MILHGISESENEEGPERYGLVTEVIATTIYGGSYEEQIKIARKIPIKKTYRLGRYNSQRGRPIVFNFVYHKTVRIFYQTRNTYLEEYLQIGSRARKPKTKEEF